MRSGSGLVVLGFAVLAACAPAAQRGPGIFGPAPFPKADKLEELAAQPAPTPANLEPIADVESWTLTGPLPATTEAFAHTAAPENPWDWLFVPAVSKQKELRPTEPLYCVARELALFQLANEGRPPEDLQRFIVARCGSTAVSVYALMSTWKNLDEKVTEDELAPGAKAVVEKAVLDIAAGGEADVGIAFARKGDRAILLIAAATRLADVSPVQMASGPKLTVKGTVRQQAASVEVLVNRGRFEVGRCVPDAKVALPAFSFTCEAAPADTQAWIEVSLLPPERILAHEVATVLIAPSGAELTRTYKRPGGAVAGTASPDIAAGFLAALNAVRAEAGLGGVRSTEAQTALANRVAPHYFSAALSGGRDQVADFVALGMLAGWKVDGIVHEGALTSAWSGQSTDPRRLLASMLETPTGRHVLLERDADVIAVGSVLHPERRFLAALVTVYTTYEPVVPEERVKRVKDHIAKLRAARGLAAPVPIAGISKEIDAAVQRIETQHYAPKQALQSFTQDVSMKSRKPVLGYVFETRDLDDFELPPEIEEAAFLPLETVVAYHRPPGEAWGRWVIIVITVTGAPA